MIQRFGAEEERATWERKAEQVAALMDIGGKLDELLAQFGSSEADALDDDRLA